LAEGPKQLTVDLKSLATLLVKHFNLHEGHFEAGPQLAIAVGPVAPAPAGSSVAPIPGVILGIGGIALQRTPGPTPNSVDAGVVNPAGND
jgi:hypothetical protein